MLGRGKEEHAKRIAAEEAAAAKKAAEEEQQAKDEGLDAVTVALDRIGQSLKIINEDMTEDWGKTGLVRQQVKRAKAELRSNLVKAAKEMQRFAAGRREGDAEPPYMEMVDVDDLKAACNVYEKRLAEEHAQVVHLKRSNKSLEAQVEKQKAEIEAQKAFISRQEERFRPAYGREEVCYPRRCVFWGTTNRTDYVKDDTGNRRFLPIKTTKVNINPYPETITVPERTTGDGITFYKSFDFCYYSF